MKLLLAKGGSSIMLFSCFNSCPLQTKTGFQISLLFYNNITFSHFSEAEEFFLVLAFIEYEKHCPNFWSPGSVPRVSDDENKYQISTGTRPRINVRTEAHSRYSFCSNN